VTLRVPTWIGEGTCIRRHFADPNCPHFFRLSVFQCLIYFFTKISISH
jgi:hypothetical protein